MKLLELLKKKQDQTVQDGWAEYIEILKRADKPREQDAARLAEIMPELEISAADVEQHVVIHADILRNVGMCCKANELEARHAAFDPKIAKARETLAEVQAEVNKLRADQDAADKAYQEALAARDRVHELCRADAKVFGGLLAELTAKYPALVAE